MNQLFDFALLVICSCSALYCWMLSKRLRALQNLRKGMGKAMVDLTKSVTAVETNAAKLNREASTAVAELRDALRKVDAYEAKVDVLLGTMDRQARETWRDFKKKSETTQQHLKEDADTLRELMDDAREMTAMLNEQLIKVAEAQKLTDAPATVVARATQPVDAEPKRVTATALDAEKALEEQPTVVAHPKADTAPLQKAPVRTEVAEKRSAAATARRVAALKLAAARAAARSQAAKESATEETQKTSAAARVAAVARKLSEAQPATLAASPQSQHAASPSRSNPFLERATRRAS